MVEIAFCQYTEYLTFQIRKTHSCYVMYINLFLDHKGYSPYFLSLSLSPFFYYFSPFGSELCTAEMPREKMGQVEFRAQEHRQQLAFLSEIYFYGSSLYPSILFQCAQSCQMLTQCYHRKAIISQSMAADSPWNQMKEAPQNFFLSLGDV